MNKVELTVATSDYDHLRDFRLGEVKAEGIEATFLTMDIHEVFSRFTFNREWEVSELSFAKFIAQATRDEPDIIGLPVYPSRMFRFSSFYVNKNAGITKPEDLVGKKVGVPEWAQSAAVYTRGWLQHEAGVTLQDIDWYQAGTDEAGRIEKVEINLPKGVRLTPVPDKTLSGMIASGELDCVMIARAPKVYLNKHPDVVRLFPNYQEMEEEFYDRTNIFPIMHIITLRKDVLEKTPWVARNLLNAFEESKRRSIARAMEISVSRYPIPWLTDYTEKMHEKFGGDIFPYGIDANRDTLEAFLLYAYEQGIAHKHVAPEDIFPEGIMASVKV